MSRAFRGSFMLGHGGLSFAVERAADSTIVHVMLMPTGPGQQGVHVQSNSSELRGLANMLREAVQR